MTSPFARHASLVRTLLVLAVLVLPAGAAGGAAKAPALKVVDRDPLVVRATAFAPLERVVVRATSRTGVVTKRLRASRSGAFTVRFSAAYDYCAGIRTVRITGPRSGTVHLRPRPSERFCPIFD